jgi:hypothetical protein
MLRRAFSVRRFPGRRSEDFRHYVVFFSRRWRVTEDMKLKTAIVNPDRDKNMELSIDRHNPAPPRAFTPMQAGESG